MMERLYLFVVDPVSSLPEGMDGSEVLGLSLDCSNQPSPQVGDRRITERTRFPESIDPRFPEANTHFRPGPWVISSPGQSYIADLPVGQDYQEVIIYKCSFQPLSEAENPWILMERAQVSIESFGGDVAAFRAWQASKESEQTVGV